MTTPIEQKAIELKPCPFCGDAASTFRITNEFGNKSFQVQCCNRKCRTTTGWGLSKTKAAAIWNTRHFTPNNLEQKARECAEEIKEFLEFTTSVAIEHIVLRHFTPEEHPKDQPDKSEDEIARKYSKAIIGTFFEPLGVKLTELEDETLVTLLHESNVEAQEPLKRELEEVKKAAGLCDKHKPNGGARNCLVCGCEKLSHTLSHISYACGEPNDYNQSDYDVHFDEEEVLKQVIAMRDSLKQQLKDLQFTNPADKSYTEVIEGFNKEVEKYKQRVKELANLIWKTRWVSKAEDYQSLVGIAAEIRSENYNGIDAAIKQSLKGEQKV